MWRERERMWAPEGKKNPKLLIGEPADALGLSDDLEKDLRWTCKRKRWLIKAGRSTRTRKQLPQVLLYRSVVIGASGQHFSRAFLINKNIYIQKNI